MDVNKGLGNAGGYVGGLVGTNERAEELATGSSSCIPSAALITLSHVAFWQNPHATTYYT